MKEKTSEYKNIFKSTFLFGFVQIFNILTKVLLNKAAAVFLGVEGIGLIGIFQSVSEMLKTFFGLGISQSVVRDISKANNDGDKKEFSFIITITHKIIWLTASIGFMTTIITSSYLSIWSFGSDKYSFMFILLSFVVLLNILADGQLGILKGMRQLRALAKATIFGSVTGLVTGIPFYYFLGKDGIVPTLLTVAISSVIFSTYYVKKVEYAKVVISLVETIKQSSNIVKMGFALMFVTFAGILSETIIKIYIGNTSELNLVGIYQAGVTITSGYFSILIVAMMTDYYPRISAINNDNKKLILELNKQVKVGLILITPLIVGFLFVMQFFVEFLYSKDFLMAIDYMRYALFWTLIIICSNPIDMILVAKQNTKVFLLVTILYRIFGTLISLYGFHNYGLEGLGIALLIMGFVHLLLMQTIVGFLYNIKLEFETYKMFFISLVLAILSFYASGLSNDYIKYSFGLLLLFISMSYSIYYFKMITKINIFDYLKNKLFKRKEVL